MLPKPPKPPKPTKVPRRPLPRKGYLFETYLTQGQVIDIYNARFNGKPYKVKSAWDTRRLAEIKLSDPELKMLYNQVMLERSIDPRYKVPRK